MPTLQRKKEVRFNLPGGEKRPGTSSNTTSRKMPKPALKKASTPGAGGVERRVPSSSRASGGGRYEYVERRRVEGRGGRETVTVTKTLRRWN
jgi:hypothetical protein